MHSRPHILYLTHRVPYPPDKGDRIRNYHVLRFLAPRARVHLACLADEPVAPETWAALTPLCDRLAIVPNRARWLRAGLALAAGGSASVGAFSQPGLRRVLRDWAATTPYAATLTSASSLVPYQRLPELRGTQAVVDLVDVDSQKWFDYAAGRRGPRAWLHRLEGRRLRRLERDLPAAMHAVTLVSEAEADLYRAFCRPGRICAVANGVDLEYFQPRGQREEAACVFVGALDYPPNIDASCWFATHIWPRVRQRQPGAALWLVGRNPVPAVRRLGELPGVTVVGAVPDVRPYLARAAVAIAPLRLARGLQNKVLEALAMGKAAVASPQALAALRVEDGVQVLSASTISDWVSAVVGLLDDLSWRQRLGAAGRDYVETHHHWDRCLLPLAALLGLEAPARGEPVAPLSSASGMCRT